MHARGRLFPPGSSAGIAVTLERVGDGDRYLVLDGTGATLAEAVRSDLQISARIGSIPRRVTLSDGRVFVSSDNAEIDRMFGLDGDGWRNFIHRLESRWRSSLALVVAAPVAGMLFYFYGLPLLVSLAVALTPPAVPMAMGAGEIVTFDRAFFSHSKLPQTRQDEIGRDFHDLAGASTLAADRFHLVFRHGNRIGPNAFALPDGTIVVTDELVTMTTSEDEVLAVLAHEIGHVEYQHSLRMLYNSFGLYVMVILASGDVGDVLHGVFQQGTVLLTLKNSREFEAAADARSVDLMVAVHRDPRALVSFFKKLMTKCPFCNEFSFYATHPGLEERVAAVEAEAAQHGK